jgi:hypothetical protein
MAATFQFVAFITISALLYGAGADTWARIGAVVNTGLSALGFPQLKISALTAALQNEGAGGDAASTRSSSGGGAPASRESASASASASAAGGAAPPSAPASVPSSRAPTPVAGAQTAGSDIMMPSAGAPKKVVDLRFRPVARNASK